MSLFPKKWSIPLTFKHLADAFIQRNVAYTVLNVNIFIGSCIELIFAAN